MLDLKQKRYKSENEYHKRSTTYGFLPEYTANVGIKKEGENTFEKHKKSIRNNLLNRSFFWNIFDVY